MDFVRIVEASLAALGPLRVAPVVLDERYACARRQEGGSPISLASRFFRVEALGEIRSVLVRSAKIQVANLFFFPAPERDLPAYVMEFVVAGGRPVVAVLDAPCLSPGLPCRERVPAEWGRQRRRYADLPQAADAPAWYAACRSGHDFFVRPGGAGELARLGQAHADLWRMQAAWMASAGFLLERQQAAHRQAIAAYKRHHAVHAPGLPLLRRRFGAGWADAYMADVLFA